MRGASPAGRIRLLDYFKLTSLLFFILVAIALYFLERSEHTFFEAAQREQSEFFAQAQAELVREQKAAARAGLLREHEAGHLALTTVFANSLWSTHFAPLVAEAEKLPIDQCRALARPELRRAGGPPRESDACFAALGQRIMALPGFAGADAAVHAITKGSTVFKIKVYDLRGLTVYSSEHKQVGEDKADNEGWIAAVGGKPASELVHRDRFSAFEGMVENRDLIQSYVPVRAGDQRISGVFEIYSDVTPLLGHLDAASEKLGRAAAANQAKVEAAADEKHRKVELSSNLHFAVLFALLVVLYVALYLVVRSGQRILDEQSHAREAAALREQLWHREKMAALATMAANASHEIGNPLAIISGLAEDLGRAHAAGEPVASHADGILAQTSRIAGMTRRITMFATARSESSEALDVNEMIRAVRDFLSFDARYRGTRIEAALAERLPGCIGIPDHLNEVLMTLMQAYAEASLQAGAPDARVRVQTELRGKEVMIGIGCEGSSAAGPCLEASDARLDSARRRMEGMGGRLEALASGVEIYLPCFAPGG